MAGSGASLWPALTAGGRARASDVESKFDWCEANILPMLSGATTDIVYDLGSETRRWRYLWATAISPTTSAGALAIGTTTANANTVLELAGTRAFLLPRLSTVQRDALTAADGMFVYNSTTGNFNGRASGTWQSFGAPIRQQTTVSLTLDPNVNTTVAMTISDPLKVMVLTMLQSANTSGSTILRMDPTTTGLLMSNSTGAGAATPTLSMTVRIVEFF